MMLPASLTAERAVISDCGLYRYWLRRLIGLRVLGRLVGEAKPICFVMHNPSTADATQDDPTIRRCIGYAKAWGGTELIVVNRFAYRSTDPDAIFATTTADPVGPENDEAIVRAVECCHANGGLAVAAWGAPGASAKWRRKVLENRTQAILRMLADRGLPLHVLALSQDGTPKHPLYLKGDLLPTRWVA